MFKGHTTLVLVIGLGLTLLFSAGCEKTILPEIVAAQEAVDAATAEGAADLCPDEYSNAELKLKQAQLLFEDNNQDAAVESANEAKILGQEALDCALLAKQPDSGTNLGLPAELADFKETIHFPFNQNVLVPNEAKRLSLASKAIAKFQDSHKFYVLVETHADLPGTVEDNRLLTIRRAKVVRYYLIQNGVKASRIFLRPMGESDAMREMVGKGTVKGSGKNPAFRRADITILGERPDFRVITNEVFLNK